jgi:hypothetical protein
MAMSSVLRLLTVNETWLLEGSLLMVRWDLCVGLWVFPLLHMTSIHCRPFPGSWQTQFILLVVNENPDTVQVRNRVCEASPGQVLTPEAAFGTGHLVTRNISLTHQKPHAQVCHLRPLRPSQQWAATRQKNSPMTSMLCVVSLRRRLGWSTRVGLSA